MQADPAETLEQSLRDVTWWSGPAPKLWKRALSAADRSAGRSSRLARLMRSRWLPIGLPVAAALAMAIIGAAVMPSMRLSFRSAESPLASVAAERPPSSVVAQKGFLAAMNDGDSDNGRWRYSFAERMDIPNLTVASGQSLPEQGRARTPGSLPVATAAQSPLGDRHVIRKAMVDLQAEDVRGVYLKIQSLLPNEAAGEYIEQSQIHDNAGQLSGYVTVRVRGERLSEVLNTLRGLATVIKEQSDATDVTSQVVDIDARLRNERRVEQELLDLLEKRKDSPLEDVLKVSQSLAEVRGRIESLTGQQQQLARQVALATVVITIQAKPKPAPEPAQAGLLDDIGARFGSAWQEGASFLIDTLTALVRVIIGGLVWWILLVLSLWLVRRWYLRRAAA